MDCQTCRPPPGSSDLHLVLTPLNLAEKSIGKAGAAPAPAAPTQNTVSTSGRLPYPVLTAVAWSLHRASECHPAKEVDSLPLAISPKSRTRQD